MSSPRRAISTSGTTRLDETDVNDRFRHQLPADAVKRYERNLAKARGKDSLKAFAKLTERVDGEPRIVSDPPLIVRLEELASDVEADKVRAVLHHWFRAYRQSLQPDRRHLLEEFRLVDVARKVVGVGSVGTRCWIALMLGRDDDDPLFLQIKEAEASVLEPYVRKSAFKNHGQRVVEGQRLMQSASDIFLGWEREAGVEGTSFDFYVRQMWDGKFSPAIELMEPEVLRLFAGLCGSTLARAHARTGDRIAIAAYLGGGDAFDRAVVDFSGAYATRTSVTTRRWSRRSRMGSSRRPSRSDVRRRTVREPSVVGEAHAARDVAE